MAFPLLINISFWLLQPTLFLVLGSAFIEQELAEQYTLPLLLGILVHSSGSVGMTIFSLHLAGLSVILGANRLYNDDAKHAFNVTFFHSRGRGGFSICFGVLAISKCKH